MKKILTSLMILISSFFFVSQANALEYYDKIEFKTAFEESINTDEIKSIGVAMGVDPTAQGESYYTFDTELLIEENYYYVYGSTNKEKVMLGELSYLGILVDIDAGGTKYITDVNITYPTQRTAVIQILVYPKDITTTQSTADQKVMEEVIKDHIMTDEERKQYEEYKKQEEARKTTTTRVPDKTVVVTDPATGEPVIDPETGEQVTTVIPGSTTTTTKTSSKHELEVSKKKEEEELEKKERDEKENFILIVMWSIIGCIVVVGGVFIGIKFYKASKMQ